MSIVYSCPVGTAIADIVIDNCPEQVGQVQKMIFQRMFDGSTRNQIAITGANEHTLQATYTALFAAPDGTKMQITPFVESPNLTTGDPETVGGGNDSIDGVPQIIAQGPTTFEGMFYQKGQKSIKSIKDLASERLQVYFVNEHGKIIGETDDQDSPTYFRGFEINERSFFVSDKSFGGYNDRDSNRINFALKQSWSDGLLVVDPADFNPLSDLTN